LEKIEDFNRLSVKEKAEIIAIAMLALGVVVASSAFIYPTVAGMTAAGTYGVGAVGTFGKYNYLAMLGTVEFAKSTAGVLVVKSGVAAAGAGILATGFGLANRGDKLTKKYMNRLPHRQPKTVTVPQTKVPEASVTTPQPPLSSPKKFTNLSNVQIIGRENSAKDNGESYRNLGLGDLEYRYDYIMGSDKLTQTEKDQMILSMLADVYLRFKKGAKDVDIDQALEICILINNYDMWQMISKEVAIKNGVSPSEIDLSEEQFDKIRQQ
jgi:hypothetical protein